MELFLDGNWPVHKVARACREDINARRARSRCVPFISGAS